MSYCNIHFCSCEALGLNPIFSNQVILNKNKDGKDLSYIQICDTNILKVKSSCIPILKKITLFQKYLLFLKNTH